jgi:pimeloyl-ACP methyl ester carboxylesterase
VSRDVGVLIVHGIGSQRETFSDELRGRLRTRIRKLGQDPSRIAWESGYWAAELEHRENELWNDMSLGALRWDRLRRFVVSALGDAVAYRPSGTGHRDIYFTIHEAIQRRLRSLRHELGDVDKPLIVLAHSLGGQVISNYAWDARHGRYLGESAEEWTPFERMETLVTFVTFGCNIPLLTLAYDRVESIPFPPPELPAHLRAVAKWLNFYDADDVLGYPLRTLSASYEQTVTEDIAINVGNPFQFWNPLAHGGYWQDRRFVRPAAHAIADVLRATLSSRP